MFLTCLNFVEKLENTQPKDNIFKVPEVPRRPEPEEIAFEEEVVTQEEEYFEEEYVQEEEEYIHEEEEYFHEEEQLITEEEVVPVIPVKGRSRLLQRGARQHLWSLSVQLGQVLGFISTGHQFCLFYAQTLLNAEV